MKKVAVILFVLFALLNTLCINKELETKTCSGFIDQGENYKSILDLKEVDGKTAFLVRDGKDFVVYDGKKGDEFDFVLPGSLSDIHGKPVYGVKKGTKYFIVSGSDEIGKEYDYALSPQNVDGKLVYLTGKGNQTCLIYDGEEYACGDDRVVENTIKKVGGKLAYNIVDSDENNESYIVTVYDGKKYWLDSVQEINGKLSDIEWIDGKLSLVYDGAKVCESFKFIPRRWYDVNGKLACEGDGEKGQFITYDGKEIGKEYKEAWDLSWIDGKLMYFAINDNNEAFLVTNGKEPAKKYDHIYQSAIINGKMTYVAIEGNKSFLVVDGIESQKKYDEIQDLIEINKKSAYTAREGDEWIVVYDGCESNKYLKLSPPIGVNGKVVFIATTEKGDHIVETK